MVMGTEEKNKVLVFDTVEGRKMVEGCKEGSFMREMTNHKDDLSSIVLNSD